MSNTITLDSITGKNSKSDSVPPSLALSVIPGERAGTFICRILHPNTRQEVFSQTKRFKTVTEAMNFLRIERDRLVAKNLPHLKVEFEPAANISGHKKNKGNKHLKDHKE